MKKLIVFESRPDYVFSDDECGHAYLVWPDHYTFTEEEDGFDGEADCFHTREKTESGEFLEYLVFYHEIPASAEELDEIFWDSSEDVKAL